ncbi:hypothetical protein G6F22_021579 [Rhizopus arrhizus]|uniref:Uncharacterized protein n=1 Tax=Rhizopus oryzae TaxID=64495 RepID=A0A9P7BIL9_RHIOR|nr:hypothetical protein G6F22_021579 [Rhizopus arrhizus]KAG1237716.1 hypothetical protein G6F68_018797 [Rhizopus microsporus]KAG0923305.1 hypothetical protein G6F31_019563 [Rhizopus arrhizus]KAG1165853.1 hypothetical protein G6F35_018536 [Rhizopus arrhizus]KAG1273471.1 hypothetical protein G6F64_015346 [Rhizopus arrhizus]
MRAGCAGNTRIDIVAHRPGPPVLYAMVSRNDTRNHDNHFAARHRSVQIQHDASGAASIPRCTGRVPLQVPHRGRRLAPLSG